MTPRASLVLASLSLPACYGGAAGTDAGPATASGTASMSEETGSSGQPAPPPTTGETGADATSAAPIGDAGSTAGTTAGDTSGETGLASAVGETSSGEASGDTGGESSSGGEPFPPPDLACEYDFFAQYFEQANGAGLADLRDEAFAAIAARTAELQACAPAVTLGGTLSLLIFEGAARVAMFNTKCAENSYDDAPNCYDTPKARYSYQFGLAPVHTSNFHPCADVGWTGKMRARLQTALDAAEFVPDAAAVAAVAGELHTFCPNSAPTAVDYYILRAHDLGVPKDASGNDLEHAGSFPFFTPGVMIDLFFATLLPACADIDSDNDAIAIFGGGDASYQDPAKQAQILGLWNEYRAAHCP